jgi:large subunit ribosomal protein L1
MKIDNKEIEVAVDKAIELSIRKKEDSKDKVRKFDESIDLIVNLKGLNLKDPKNRIDEEFVLPHKILFDKKVPACFIASGDMQLNAKKLGYEVLDEEALEEFDKSSKKEKKKLVKKYKFFITEQNLMRSVARYLARFLGPLGKMPKPSPKGYGIIREQDNLEDILERHRRIVKIRMRQQPLIQLKVGKKSMDINQIAENVESVVKHIAEQLPSKWNSVKSIYIKTSMGKPVKVGV